MKKIVLKYIPWETNSTELTIESENSKDSYRTETSNNKIEKDTRTIPISKTKTSTCSSPSITSSKDRTSKDPDPTLLKRDLSAKTFSATLWLRIKMCVREEELLWTTLWILFSMNWAETTGNLLHLLIIQSDMRPTWTPSILLEEVLVALAMDQVTV